MDLKRVIKKLGVCYDILKGKIKPSFAQFGEDKILDYLIYDILEIAQPSYLDIGANHPVYGSNTYYFYTRGSKGVLVEPDPYLVDILKAKRKKDTILNIGIGIDSKNEAADFYVYDNAYKGLNTFSKEEAEMRKADGIVYNKIIQMPLVDVNSIIQQHFTIAPDLLSIDVEGLDFEIMKSLDFDIHAPKVICIETIRFGDTAHPEKRTDLVDFILSKGYRIFGDTYINTIFYKK